jgi:RNA recognition motif-containing protein
MTSWADAIEEDEDIPPPLPQLKPRLAPPAPDPAEIPGPTHPPSRPAPPAPAPAETPLPTHPPYVAFVGNLPPSASEVQIRELFAALSIEPTGVRLPVDKGTDRHKGFAYVTFADGPTLSSALAAHGHEVMVRAVSHTPRVRCGASRLRT